MSLAYATREQLFSTLCLVLLLVASFSLCAVTRQISSHDQTSLPLLGKRPIPPDPSHPDATKSFQNNKRVIISSPDLLHNRTEGDSELGDVIVR
ncbi:hypothetical protein FCM35_KLT15452 [Carex littledalei]|uniref:Uncharacterized protein n=1 Tax=Carex littledalei TaxID=544730 RepID=A0A833RPT5_9POAL|nr:hypothetical protein FCM35_KLT15452 [Carex littledalei]